MTAPSMTVVRRRLTVNFQRSVKAGKPQVMEVVVAPLSSPSSPNEDSTLVGGIQSQDVLLGNEKNPVFFDLVPTDHPDLSDRLLYRIAWREKYMGRQVAEDFVMPDFDCDYDDLKDLGNIVGGETYVQWSDRSRPGGVAGLNESGQVIDSSGNPVNGQVEADAVQDNLDNEVIARAQGDEFLRAYFLSYANQMVTEVTAAATQGLANATNQANANLAIEKQSRQDADAAIHSDITGLTASTATGFSGVHEDINAVNAKLTQKADLVNGKIPSDQIPSVAVGNAVPVTSKAQMLALTPTQVQPGDICIITTGPDQGNYILNAPDPSVFTNWVELSSGGAVSSVNGQVGTVNLNAANVGARPVGVALPMSDITGLSTALGVKADNATVTTLANRVTTIESDNTVVKTVSGVIPHAQHGNDVAFLNADSQVVNKAGQVINLSGGGGVLDITDVTGLQAELNGKLDVTNPAVTNARTPLTHAASHKTGGSDPITPLPISDITGLPEVLSTNSLSVTSNHGNRISSLETAIEGAATGSGSPAKAVWFDNIGPIAPTSSLAAFTSVMQKSPFGRNTSGLYYYDPAGAAEGEWVYPYISPNGHLVLRQRNETNPPDPSMATQAGLDNTNAILATKADQTALASTNAAVNTKAAQVNLDATNAQVATKASQAALNSLSDTVATKANQADLTALTTATGTKANQSDLVALQTVVGTKADQSSLATTNANVTTLQTNKADLVSGMVPLQQIPPLPTSKVTNLDIALGAKANLDGTGVVALTEIPALPQSRITNLTTTLASKADLVAGVVPANQLPALAFSTTVPVTSRAQMLALTPVQVQPGDVCVITTGVDQGSYILNATDPSVFTNWVPLSTPGGAVSSVNGKVGVVSLSLTDMSTAGGAITQAQVTGLPTALSTKADAAATTTALAAKADKADVQGSQGAQNKLQASLVATSAVTTLSGWPTVDGVATSPGSVVLVTKQPSSVDNGLYVVGGTSTDPWLRTTDTASASFIVQGTMVTVKGGVAEHDTFWQMTRASGIVGTDPNNWVKVATAGALPPLTGSRGVQAVRQVNPQGVTTAIDFQAQVVTGGGLQATSAGLMLDPSKAVRKVAITAGDNDPITGQSIFTTGSPTATITHNLGSVDVAASFRSKLSGDAVLVGWRPLDTNSITVEFDSAVQANSYRVVVMG